MKMKTSIKLIASTAAMATCATAGALALAPNAQAQTSPWEDKPMGYTAFGITPENNPNARIKAGLASPSGQQTIFGSYPRESRVTDLSADARTMMVTVPEGKVTQFSMYDTIARRTAGQVRVTGDVRGARLTRSGSHIVVNTTTEPVWTKYHVTGGGKLPLKGISATHEMTESLDGGYVFGINAQGKLQQTDSHTGATVKAAALPSGFETCNPSRALDNARIVVQCAKQDQSGTVFAFNHETGKFANLSAPLPASRYGYTDAWLTKQGLLVGRTSPECAAVPGWVKGSSWTKINSANADTHIDTFFGDGTEAVAVVNACGDGEPELVSVPTQFDGDYTPMVGRDKNPGYRLTSWDVQDDLQ